MIERIRNWYRKIPEMEKDLPILLVRGKVYSAREVMREVERGTELGREMQAILERRRGMVGSEETRAWKVLGKKRAIAWAEKLPEDYSIISVQGREATKRDLIEMIRKEEPLGKSAADVEMKRILKLHRMV